MRMSDIYNILYETIAECSEWKPGTYILKNPRILLLFPRTWLLLLTQTSFMECPIEIKKKKKKIYEQHNFQKKSWLFDWILFCRLVGMKTLSIVYKN